MGGDNKTINYIQCPTEFFDQAAKISSMIGMDIRDFIIYAAQLSMMSNPKWLEVKENDNAEVVAYKSYMVSELMTRSRTYIRLAAHNYNELGAKHEGLAEMIELACEMNEIDYDDVIQKTADDPLSAIIKSAMKKGSKFSDCVTWLMNLVQERKWIRSSEVYDLASNHPKKFSGPMIRRAKDHINKHLISGPKIVSERIEGEGEKGWAFVYTEESQVEQDTAVSLQEEDDSVDDFSNFLISNNDNSI